jgi:hypothetical protein
VTATSGGSMTGATCGFPSAAADEDFRLPNAVNALNTSDHEQQCGLPKTAARSYGGPAKCQCRRPKTTGAKSTRSLQRPANERHGDPRLLDDHRADFLRDESAEAWTSTVNRRPTVGASRGV